MLGMVETKSYEHLWPYLLFLPAESESRDEFIRGVMASRITRSVLSSFHEDGRVLQRDLIQNLNHSNKSVLSYLKTLNRFGLITTSTTIHNGKRVVYHELTKSGWGLARFYSEGLPSDIEALTAFLLEDYLIRLTTLYKNLGIPESRLFDIFARTRAKAILEDSQKFSQPDIAVFGASAYNTRIECTKMPPAGGLASCSSPIRSPGGSTVELAIALAKEGLETSFISSVGNDLEGWEVITQLIQGGVDVTHIAVEDGKSTNESIIITENSTSRMLVGVGPITSLSINSPSQVPWNIVEKAKAVYIGELFVEVAASITAYAKAHGIPLVYRCSVPFWEMGIDRLKPVLSQVDTLILSNQVWRHLNRVMGTKPIPAIREVTDAAIIIKDTGSSYRLLKADEQEVSLRSKSESIEMTRWFSVGFLKKISMGSTINDSFEFGVEYENGHAAKA
jgi:sugar/nucleoside kinase (ribokinase family)/DNA-binding MarR family transcriptional regulator